jgi:hypothetical protein
MSFRYAAGINKPGFNPLAAGVDQYKGIWSLSGQANAHEQNPPLSLWHCKLNFFKRKSSWLFMFAFKTTQ